MTSFTLSDLTDAPTLLRAIEQRLTGVVTTTHEGDSFLFYDPDGITVPEQRFPFCTLITGDHPYDAASLLDRDAITYRVNVEVSRARYEELFGPAPREPAGHAVLDTGFDYSTTDTLLPHPLYAPLHWVCVVNPGPRTAADLAALLDRAHGLAKRRYDNRRDRAE
jgi:hypothetical protein